MSDIELLEQNTVLPLLERIATTLERIETILAEKQNKTQDAKDCRELMQSIVKHYRDTEPRYDIQVGSTLTVFRFRNAIAKIKNIRNSNMKAETRKLYKWIHKLEEFEFIERTTDSTFLVLDLGENWGFK